MKNQDSVGVEFVNSVVGRGILNNVINLSFATYNFTPNENGEIDIDAAISCRLRMDKACAIQLRDVMISLIQAIEEAELKPQVPGGDEGVVISKKASETTH